MQRGAEKRGCSKDRAIAAEGRGHVDFPRQSTRLGGCVDWEGEILMHLRRDFWFENEGDIVVIRMDMPDGQQSSTSEGNTDLAYSIRDSVTCGALSFLIKRIFRGGDGHCKDRRSLV